jgi:hypothetical protein
MTGNAGYVLRAVFAGSVPKDAEYPNEDQVCYDEDHQVFLISDGASESYNSRLWAELLVNSWLAVRPKRSPLRWFDRALAGYESRSPREQMSWSEEAAYERGSFASILAVELQGTKGVRVTAVGDSTAVLVDAGRIRDSFPYQRPEQFRSRPHLISTIRWHNRNAFLHEAVTAFRRGEDVGP